MISSLLAGDVPFGRVTLTLLAALAPAALSWWTDRRLLGKGDDPALPELLASRSRANIRNIAIGAALIIVFGGSAAAWGIPLLLAALVAAGYSLRTRLLGETWSFGRYLWHTTLSIVGGFGFWIALAYLPSIVAGIVRVLGRDGRWFALAAALVLVAAMVAWEAWYPRIWLWAHDASPLASPELTPRFDEIVRRAGTVTPAVYRVGPQGSRFVNAVALPSVRWPSVAMGNALVELLDADEAAAIFAHEVAHFDHFTRRHIRRSQLANRALIVVGAATPLVTAFTSIGWSPWLGWLWPFVVILAIGRRAAKSQQHETESDLRAAALCGDPEALVRGLVKLHAHARVPRRYAVDVERAASHPSLVRRIQAIRAGGAAAVEQLGEATIVRSTREESWVVLDDARAYWLDGVPPGTDATLAALRDAASSYRAVNYHDLVELRVAASGATRALHARTRGGESWSVPIAADDVARVQRALDIVDLRLAKPGAAPTPAMTRFAGIMALAVAIIAGQLGVLLVPIGLVFWRAGPASLAALGAMSIVRAAFGAIEGNAWWSEEVVRLALLVLAALGAVAIVAAWRHVKSGAPSVHLRLTSVVLAGAAVLVAIGVITQAAKAPSSLVGAPLVGTLGTLLLGLAAALLTAPRAPVRRAGLGGLVVATGVAVAGVDVSALAMRRALAETRASATLVSETDLGGAAYGLRVSPAGTHFLVMRSPTVRRPGARPMLSLVVGRMGGPTRELAAFAAEFVDEEHVLVLEALEHGVEVRLEATDSAAAPVWADTLTELDGQSPRLALDRDAGSWSVVGEDADDRTVVVTGNIGEKGSTERVAIPDTLPLMGEPLVFARGASVLLPTMASSMRRGPASGVPVLAMLSSMPPFSMDYLRTDLWRVHGDSLARVASLRGPLQCGEPEDGATACVVRVMKATSLYVVSADGSAQEVAQIPVRDMGVVSAGPGLRAASMTFDGTMLLADLAARRLTRVQMPAGTPFASDVRAGPGFVATLGVTERGTSKVRFYTLR